MACEINGPTALVFLLAASWIQATTATSSMTGTSNSLVSPNSTTTFQASLNTTNVTGVGSVITISSKSSASAQVSSIASGNVSAAASNAATSLDSNPSTSVAQVSVDVSSVKTVAATESGVKTSSITSNVIVPSSSATTSMGSNSSTVSQASDYSVSSVTATTVAVSDSNNTTSVVSVGVLSTASTGNTSINQTAAPTSIVTPQLSVSSAGNITQPVATATETTMAPYTSQSPAPGASSQSAVPSPETSSKRSPEPHASTSDNVTGSANSQRAITTVAPSIEIGVQSQQVSVTPISPVPQASSTASVLVTSSLLNPTLGLPSPSHTSPPSSWTEKQSTQARWSASVSGQHEITTVMTSFLEDSLTVSVGNSTSSVSLPVNASSTSSANTSTPTLSQRPTFPPEGTKVVSIELSLDMEFKEEYNDPNSRAYKNLVANLTIELKNVYKKVDGFVDIHILYITKGSVICSFIVILAKNSQVKEEKLKEVLEQAQKDGTFTFEVKSIEVVEEPTKKPEQKLPEWALITIIVLASLAFVFLVTVICVCVKYRRSVSGDNDAYYVASGDLGMHTYETVVMGDIKMRANAGGKTSTAERHLVGSHTNPTYGSNGALAD